MRSHKSNRYFWTLAIILTTPVITLADEEAERAALRRIRETYEQVVQSNDLSKLMPYLAKDFTAVTPTAEQVKNPAELQGYFKRVWELIGKGGIYNVKVNVDQTDLYGDIAVSRGTTEEFIRSSIGNEFKERGFWTAVSQKQDGEWKVIRMHGSINPLTNSFVTHFRAVELRTTKWVYGLGGLILGLAVGFLTRFIRRSRS